MPETLKRKLIHSLSASALGPFVTLFVQVVSVPLLLKGWGAQRYGEWLLLSALPSYLSMTDMGFASAAANEMSIRVASGDRESALEIYQSITALISAISVLGLSLAAIAATTLPTAAMLHIETIPAGEISVALLLLSAYSLLTLFSGVLAAGFRCDGNFARGVTLQTLTRLIESMGMISVVLFGAGVAEAALSLLIARIAGTLFMAGQIKARSPWLSLGTRHVRLATIRKLSSPAFSFLAIPVGNALSLQGLVLVVGHILGPIPATIFSTLRTMSRFGLQFTDILKNGVWPEISVAFAKSDLLLARRLYGTALQLTSGLSIGGAIFLWLTGKKLFGIWTHNRVAFDNRTLSFLLVASVAASMWSTASVALLATNTHRRLASEFVLATSCSLLISIALTSSWKLSGTAVSVLLSDLVMLVCAVNGSRKGLGKIPHSLFSPDTLGASSRRNTSPTTTFFKTAMQIEATNREQRENFLAADLAEHNEN